MVVDTVDMSWESVPGGVVQFWDATLTEGDPLGRPWSYFQRLLDQARAGGGGAYRAMAAPAGTCEWVRYALQIADAAMGAGDFGRVRS
jgi:hypothetical protein